MLATPYGIRFIQIITYLITTTGTENFIQCIPLDETAGGQEPVPNGNSEVQVSSTNPEYVSFTGDKLTYAVLSDTELVSLPAVPDSVNEAPGTTLTEGSSEAALVSLVEKDEGGDAELRRTGRFAALNPHESVKRSSSHDRINTKQKRGNDNHMDRIKTHVAEEGIIDAQSHSSVKVMRHVDPDSDLDGNLTEVVGGTEFEIAPPPPVIQLRDKDKLHEHEEKMYAPNEKSNDESKNDEPISPSADDSKNDEPTSPSGGDESKNDEPTSPSADDEPKNDEPTSPSADEPKSQSHPALVALLPDTLNGDADDDEKSIELQLYGSTVTSKVHNDENAHQPSENDQQTTDDITSPDENQGAIEIEDLEGGNFANKKSDGEEGPQNAGAILSMVFDEGDDEDEAPKEDSSLSGRVNVNIENLDKDAQKSANQAMVDAIPGIYLSGESSEEEEEQKDEMGNIHVDIKIGKQSLPAHLNVLSVEMEDGPQSCFEARGPFRPLTNGSKYFVDGSGLYTFKQGRTACAENNLVIAELDGMADHRSLQKFVSRFKRFQKGSNTKFFIGSNDIKTEGIFKRADGKNIVFQNFHGSQPDDKNQSEDCVSLMMEHSSGPVGSSDSECNSPSNLLCMFRVNSICYNDSTETIENRKIEQEQGLKLLLNASERAYFTSNFQLGWKDAMKYCIGKNMRLFNMDGVVTMGFFRLLLKWETEFVQVPIPTLQYWTSGKFKASHMSAPIVWHSKAELTESEERGIEKHNGTFTWSGLYRWSTQKLRDPGGPHGYRRDLCVSFGFDDIPDATPFIRNTNCEMPCYFICYEEYHPSDGGDDDY